MSTTATYTVLWATLLVVMGGMAIGGLIGAEIMKLKGRSQALGAVLGSTLFALGWFIGWMIPPNEVATGHAKYCAACHKPMALHAHVCPHCRVDQNRVWGSILRAHLHTRAGPVTTAPRHELLRHAHVLHVPARHHFAFAFAGHHAINAHRRAHVHRHPHHAKVGLVMAR